jgi:hypothetical protein
MTRRPLSESRQRRAPPGIRNRRTALAEVSELPVADSARSFANYRRIQPGRKIALAACFEAAASGRGDGDVTMALVFENLLDLARLPWFDVDQGRTATARDHRSRIAGLKLLACVGVPCSVFGRGLSTLARRGAHRAFEIPVTVSGT